MLLRDILLFVVGLVLMLKLIITGNGDPVLTAAALSMMGLGAYLRGSGG